LDEWETELGRQIEQLSRAPYFVQNPSALVAVRNELQRVREGQGSDLELEEDDDRWAVVDNAWRLAAQLADAGRELDEPDEHELELFVVERLVEASLRYR
jgi:hypothetical protein